MSLKNWVDRKKKELDKIKVESEQQRAEKQRMKIEKAKNKDTKLSRVFLATQRGDGFVETIKNELNRSRYERKK